MRYLRSIIAAMLVFWVQASLAQSDREIDNLLDLLSERASAPLSAQCRALLGALFRLGRTQGILGPEQRSSAQPCLGGPHGRIAIEVPIRRPRQVLSVEEKDSITFITIPDFDLGVTTRFVREMRPRKSDFVVIDLQNNLGGYVGVVLSMLDNFAPYRGAPKVIFSGRQEQISFYAEYAILGQQLRNAFFVIVVNGQTASGALLFAHTLQQWKPANVRILGERTDDDDKYVFGASLGPYTVYVVAGSWRYGDERTSCATLFAPCSVQGRGLLIDLPVEGTDQERLAAADRFIKMKRSAQGTFVRVQEEQKR